MRIVFVNHTFPPFSWAGSEACVYQVARSMQALGHEVFVFYRYNNPADEEYRLIEEEFDGIPVARINHTHRFTSRFERTYLNRTISAIFGHWLAGVAPDLVHFHHLTNLSMDLVEEPRIRGIPAVMTLHDYWLLCQRGQLLTSRLECCHGPREERCRGCLSLQLVKGRLGGLVSLLTCAARRWQGSMEAGSDLTTLAGTKVETPDRRFVAQTRFDIDGLSMVTIQAHPPAVIRRRIRVPESSRLSFRFAMHPSTYAADGEGVFFRVSIDGECAFEHYLDPKHQVVDRGWHHGEVDLGRWAGQEVELALQTSPGPAGNIDFCTAGWAKLELHAPPESGGSARGRSELQRLAERAAQKAVSVLVSLSPSATYGVRLRRRWTEYVFERIDCFISPSRFLRDFFIRHGLNPDKIVYMDNGFLPPSYMPDPGRPVNLPIRFAYIGTWIPSKGVDLAVKAFRDVDPGKARLLIYGFFPGYEGYQDYEMRLRTWAQESPAVEFRNRYDPRDVYEILRDVDVSVVPSIWWENSPLTIHESFLAGVPVVTADVGGLAELVEDNVSGLHFRHRDWRSLRDVVRRICDHPELILRLRRGIPKVISMDEHVGSLVGLYYRIRSRRLDRAGREKERS